MDSHVMQSQNELKAAKKKNNKLREMAEIMQSNQTFAGSSVKSNDQTLNQLTLSLQQNKDMFKEIEELRDDNKELTRQLMENGSNPGGRKDQQHLINEIRIKDQENNILRNMVDDLKERLEQKPATPMEAKVYNSVNGSPFRTYTTSRSPNRSQSSPYKNFMLNNPTSKVNSSKNINFFINFLSDLYISCAGILRHCDHTIAKTASKNMFDLLSELKDDEYQLRGDLSDKLKRTLRNEHNKVNEGLKEIRKNVGANYLKGRKRIRKELENHTPSLEQQAQESENRQQKRKYDLLLKKFTDIQKDYNLLKNNKENRFRQSSFGNIGSVIKTHTQTYLQPQSTNIVHRPTLASNNHVISRQPRLSNQSYHSGTRVIYPSNGSIPRSSSNHSNRIRVPAGNVIHPANPNGSLIFSQTHASPSTHKLLHPSGSRRVIVTPAKITHPREGSGSQHVITSDGIQRRIVQGIRSSPKVIIDGGHRVSNYTPSKIVHPTSNYTLSKVNHSKVNYTPSQVVHPPSNYTPNRTTQPQQAIHRVVVSPEQVMSTTPHRLSKTLIEITPQNGNKETFDVREREGSPGQQMDLWRSSIEKSIEEFEG